MPYEHTQRGFLPLIFLVFYLIFTAVVAAFAGDERAATLTSMGVAGVIAMVAVVWFSILRIRVTNTTLRAAFGGGWPRRSFELDNVVGFRQVRNRWYYGWGIRRIKTGWMFSVWGLDAVELDLASGKRFTIGTNDPGELLSALEARTSLSRNK